jgi:uncharacterized membrane protein YedE/YeeE
MIDLQDMMISEGLVGGIFIGIAAAIMLLAAGRIAGISGLFANAVGLVSGSTSRNFAVIFMLSLLAGAWLAQVLTGEVVSRYPDNITLIIGGLLVGFGTRMGSGCTSGHGVCGLSRLSKRSLYATPIFMVAAIITVSIINLIGGIQ